MKENRLDALAIGLLLIIFVIAVDAMGSEPRVKQCIDHRTQRIVTVPANMPCPYPTVEL